MNMNLLFKLAIALMTGAAVHAQGSSGSNTASNTPVRYIVRDLGPFPGGTFSYAASIGNSALIAGRANGKMGTTDAWHAVLWVKGLTQPMDIATPGLGGQNSEAFGVNERGQASGEAETNKPDPNGEDFCGFAALGLPSNGHTCLAFLWQDGVMTALPTLGGANGSGSQINNRGEVAGYAETLEIDPDPMCPVHQFKPVMWSNGKAQQLPIPANGDLEGAAFGINDKGQVVGRSGSCVPFSPISQTYLNPGHALIWEKGGFTDLGTLPGQAGNQAVSINNRGQVVGSSGVYGFLWSRATGMQPLLPVSGDFLSSAIGINETGDAIGISIDATFTTLSAVIWEAGSSTPVNLNDRLVDNAGLYLQLAEGINSRGEIVGFAQPIDSPLETHGYVAIPVAGDEDVTQSATKTAARSEHARRLLHDWRRLTERGTRSSRLR
jgi:uncharacterized membrane protein